MVSIRKHITYANVASTMALVLALSGGAAYASHIGSRDIDNNSIRSKDIRDDTVKEKDLDFYALDTKDLFFAGKDIETENLITPDETGFENLGRVNVTIKRKQDLALTAVVNHANERTSNARLTYRVLLDGKMHHDHSYVETVQATGDPDDPRYGLSTVQIRCDGIPAGEHELTLQVRVDQAKASPESGAGVIFDTRSVQVIGFGPIFRPPSRDEF